MAAYQRCSQPIGSHRRACGKVRCQAMLSKSTISPIVCERSSSFAIAGTFDSPDPVRHSHYRSADRGYNSRYGSRDEYKDAYRAGFRTGYEDGYRRRSGPDSDRR